jgi:putative transcriptional regulator
MRSLQDHFLIAMPSMADPNFSETVTYICKHDEEGALGVIINRPSNLSLAEMLGQLAMAIEDRSCAEQLVLHGGPVEPERGFVLHRSAEDFDKTVPTGNGIKLTVSPDILAAIARGNGPKELIVALGYAGWGAGQLEAELKSKSWLTVPAEPGIVFGTPFGERWTAALGLPGVDIENITTYAGHA